jgi:hypothetical protein
MDYQRSQTAGVPPQIPNTNKVVKPTGGKVNPTATGLVHTANRRNPNRKTTNKLEEAVGMPAKDLERDFPEWIDSKIPGLANAKQDPATKTKLEQAFSTMVKSKNDLTALMTAFNSYVSLAKQVTTQAPSGNPDQDDNSDWESIVPISRQYKIDDLRKLIPPELARQIKDLQLSPNALAAYINRP